VEGLVDIVVIKSCAALLLALGACVVGRWAERPALVHALWIVVLLELLVPPLIEVGVFPHWNPAGLGDAPPHSLVSTVPVPTEVAPSASATTGPPRNFPMRAVLPFALGALWLAGAASVLLLAVVRIRRFARQLSETAEPSVELQTTARRLATRLGLKHCPRIRIVPAVISPMLRPRWGSLEILFPSLLLERLERGERDALLAHELAHVRRRDHWVRWLELAASALLWWHPLVWWARDRLRRIEERCCDGLVLDTLPGHASHYARGLVKTVELLAGAPNGLPSVACGIGEARDLEERLKMIVKRRLPRTLSRPQRVAVAIAAGALLVVLPTWADRKPDDAAELRKEEARLTASEAGVRASMAELEREAQLLESELQQIRARQRDLELELMRQREELDLRRLDAEVSESAAAGQLEAAVRLRRRQERMSEQIALESAQMREMRSLEDPLRHTLLEAEAAAQRGDDARAAQLEARAVELKVRLEEHQARSHARREWQQQMEAARTERERHDELRALGRELELLERQLDRAEAAGLRDEAAELSRHIKSLRIVIEHQERSF